MALTPEQLELYEDIPFADYLQWTEMSQSVLKQGLDSMKHLKCALDKTVEFIPTDEMILGSALHVCFLEPELMPNKVACFTGKARRGADWELFKEQNASKAILTEGMYERLQGMVRELRKDPTVKLWRSKIQGVEVSAKGMIGGIAFKGRVDALTDDPIWDLKKISSTDDRTISRSIWDYGYDIQAFIYTSIFKRTRFILGFVESEEPYDVRPIELSPQWLSIGRKRTMGLIRQVGECVKTKVWPGRSNGKIEMVEPPTWVEEQFATEVTIGGQKAF